MALYTAKGAKDAKRRQEKAFGKNLRSSFGFLLPDRYSLLNTIEADDILPKYLHAY